MAPYLRSGDIGTQVISELVRKERLHFWGIIYCFSSTLLNSGSLSWANVGEDTGNSVPEGGGEGEERTSKKLQHDDCWHLLSSWPSVPDDMRSVSLGSKWAGSSRRASLFWWDPLQSPFKLACSPSRRIAFGRADWYLWRQQLLWCAIPYSSATSGPYALPKSLCSPASVLLEPLARGHLLWPVIRYWLLRSTVPYFD